MGYFRDSKRIVIKVGTSTLTHSTGHLNLRRIEKLVKVLSDMKNVILVSGSGMAGTDSANKITTRKVMSRFYLCGDEKSDIADGCGLMAPRVAVCAAHQATAVMKLILGQSPV